MCSIAQPRSPADVQASLQPVLHVFGTLLKWTCEQGPCQACTTLLRRVHDSQQREATAARPASSMPSRERGERGRLADRRSLSAAGGVGVRALLRVVPSVSMGSIVNVWPTNITPGSRLRTCVTTGALWKCQPTPWPTKLGTTPRPYRSPISWMTCARGADQAEPQLCRVGSCPPVQSQVLSEAGFSEQRPAHDVSHAGSRGALTMMCQD